jgi:hypothetical protein
MKIQVKVLAYANLMQSIRRTNMLKALALTATLISAYAAHASLPTADATADQNALTYIGVNPATGQTLSQNEIGVYQASTNTFAVLKIDEPTDADRPWIGHPRPVKAIEGNLQLNSSQVKTIASTSSQCRLCMELGLSPTACIQHVLRPQTAMMAPYQIPIADCLRLGLPLEVCYGTMPK